MNSNHEHDHRGCCGGRMHVEGEEAAAHMMHALEVRNDWLSSAMAEAEDEDRRTGVWDLASDVWEPSDAVCIDGLKARPDLNGQTGVLLRWMAEAGRWGVEVVATRERVKIRSENLRRIGALPVATLTAGGVAKAVIKRWSSDAANADAIAKQLATSRYVVLDGFLGAGGAEDEGAAAVLELLRSLRERGELQPGDVAGGRAAAAYARITGQALPRGDLMLFLEAAQAAQHAPLRTLLAAMDELVARLERAPALAAELGPSRQPLRREEVQLTCYPSGGTRYVKHVDNNDAEAAATGAGGEAAAAGADRARRGGRRMTVIYYPNLEWKEGDGGELRLHVGEGGGDADVTDADAPPPTVDVDPVGDRLVCFWSDARVPHSVEAAHADRYAVSAWFHDCPAPT